MTLWGFRRIMICPHCHTKIYMDMRIWFYIFLLIVFFVPFLYGKELLEPHVTPFFIWTILFLIMYIGAILLQILMVRLLGMRSLYRIHDDAYYKKSAAERKREDRK